MGDWILVVDDNPINSRLASVTLELEGYAVRTASDAGEAMRLASELCPSLILMDVQLPGIDGLELTRRIRQDPLLSGVVVVAMTSYAMKGDEDRALAAGCDGYLAKPIDTRTFAQTVAGYLAARTAS